MPRKLGLAVLAVAFVIAVAWWIRDSSRTIDTSAPIPTNGVGDSTSTSAPPSVAVEARASETSSEPLPQPAGAQTSATPSIDETAKSRRVADLLVEGRVVDTHGAGVAEARVEVVTPLRGGVAGSEQWFLAGARARANADGYFQVRGSAAKLERDAQTEPPRFALRAFADGYVATSDVEFRFGDVDVNVVLAAEGRIEGELVFGDGLTWRDVAVVLGVPDEKMEDSHTRRAKRIDGGAFAFDSIQAGVWNVVVGTAGFQVLARVDGVVVASGETTRDPRLNPLRIELSAGFEIRVFLPDGTPAPRAIVSVVRVEGQRTRSTGLGQTAPGVFLALEEPDGITIEVKHDGLRREWLEHVRGPTRIDLRPGLRVEVEVDDLPDVRVRDDWQLVLVMQQDPRDHTTRPILAKIHETALVKGQRAAFELEGSGQYAWWIAEVPTFSPNRNYSRPTQLQLVHVADTDAMQALRVRAPEDLAEQLAASR